MPNNLDEQQNPIIGAHEPKGEQKPAKQRKNKANKFDYLRRIYKLKGKLAIVNKGMDEILSLNGELSEKDQKYLLDSCAYKASILKSLAWMKLNLMQKKLDTGHVSTFMNYEAQRKGYNNYDEMVAAAREQFKLYESYEQDPQLLYDSEIRSYRAKKTKLASKDLYDTSEVDKDLNRVLGK